MTIIRGCCVTLCSLQPSFFNAYKRMFSPVVQQWVHVPGLDQETVYLNERLAKMQKSEAFFYCIFDNYHRQLIGALEIRDEAESRGQLYCWVNEHFWGNNRFQEAVRVAATRYFERHSDKCYFTAHVDDINKRSLYALKKSGFALAGLHNGPRGMQHVLWYRKK